MGKLEHSAMEWVRLTQCDGIVKGEHKQCYRIDKLEHSATE